MSEKKENKKKRDERILTYLVLVKKIVEGIAKKLPAHIDKEDLVNVGIIGLISAMDRFDQTRNVTFATYAQIRIRGAILDELRSRDTFSRSARMKKAKLNNALEKLQKRLGRPSEISEIADFLGISIDDYFKLINDTKPFTMLNADDFYSDCSENRFKNYVVENTETINPLTIMTQKEQKKILQKAIQSLPEKEKITVSSYYYEDMALKEIGTILKLTESRISQIHAQAIRHIKNQLEFWVHNEEVKGICRCYD